MFDAQPDKVAQKVREKSNTTPILPSTSNIPVNPYASQQNSELEFLLLSRALLEYTDLINNPIPIPIVPPIKMVVRALVPTDPFPSDKWKADIDGKKLPKYKGSNAPTFDGKSEHITDFLRTVEQIFSELGLDDEGTQIETAAHYVSENIRDQWKCMPGYARGGWKAFKQELLASYNRSADDIKYTLSDLDDFLAKFEARRVQHKDRWNQFQRECIHILKYLVTMGEITEKKAVQKIEDCVTPLVWENAISILRNDPAKATTSAKDWFVNIDRVLNALNKCLEETAVLGDRSRYREEKSTDIKMEDFADTKNTIANLRDIMVIAEKNREKDREEAAREREETKANHQRFLDTVTSTLLATRTQHYQDSNSSSNFAQATPIMVQPSAPITVPVRQNMNPTSGTIMGPGVRILQNPNRNNNPGRGPLPPLMKINPATGLCFFCEKPGHMREHCPDRKKLLEEGWIVIMEGTNWDFLPNSNPLLRKERAGINPLQQVLRYKEEHSRTQSVQIEDDDFAPKDVFYIMQSQLQQESFF